MGNSRYEFINSLQGTYTNQLLYLASSRFENDWNSTRHAHTCAEMFFCIDGRGRFFIQDEIFDVTDGDVVLINANVEHTEQSFSDSPLEYIVLGVSGLEFSHANKRGYDSLRFQPQREIVQNYLNAILHEVSLRELHYAEACQYILGLLLIQVQRLSDVSIGNTGVESAHPVNKNAAWAKHYIDEHYSEDLTLDRIAAIVRMNKYSLGHLFRESFGFSPINHLIRRRLEEAKHLLGNSDLSVSQIAEVLNFSSLSYFSQRFHSKVGMSPKAYRESVNGLERKGQDVSIDVFKGTQ